MEVAFSSYLYVNKEYFLYVKLFLKSRNMAIMKFFLKYVRIRILSSINTMNNHKILGTIDKMHLQSATGRTIMTSWAMSFELNCLNFSCCHG